MPEQKQDDEATVTLTINQVAEVMATAAGKALNLTQGQLARFTRENHPNFLPAAREVKKIVEAE